MSHTSIKRKLSTKEEVIQKLLQRPELMTNQDIESILVGEDENKPLSHEELRGIFLRIFDINDKDHLGGANHGPLGFLNGLSQKRRNKKFFKKIKKKPSLKKIIIEGDSWFEHPLIKDTFDWLGKKLKGQYALYSLAHGGDWLMNIIRDGKYISELPIIKPEVLMLSGGGNDLVDYNRLSLMIDSNPNRKYHARKFRDSQHKYSKLERLLLEDNHRVASQGIRKISIEEASNIQRNLEIGVPYLSRDFWSALWGLELSYRFIIRQIRQKYPHLRIMILGYDYAIPSFSAGPGIFQWVMNKVQNNGHWLKESLLLSGVEDEESQHAIIFSLIYLFNSVLSEISNSSEQIYSYEVYHLDGRNIANNKNDWFDELHLKSKGFEKLADRAIQIIEKGQRTLSETPNT